MRGDIKTKRWSEAIEESDGTRILVCRYRPRWVAKGAEPWDIWYKDLGPSPELLAYAHGKTEKSPGGKGQKNYRQVFAKEYREEMKLAWPLIAQLAEKVLNGQTLTLLCSSSCTDEKRCHRSLLKALIEKQVKKLED